jgi:hypothetical protein
LFVFFLFQGREQIDQHTRTILYGVLLVVGFLGLVMLVILPAVIKEIDALNPASAAFYISVFLFR